MFKDGETNVHNEVVSRPPVVGVDLVQSGIWRSTISELSCEFPHISYNVLHVIISYARLTQVVPKVGSKNAHVCP
jgi:hypothetical protein